MSQALTKSFGAMGLGAKPGRRARLTEQEQEVLDQQAYQKIKQIVQDPRLAQDIVTRDHQINLILNPVDGSELSAPMLLKIAVEFCAALCPDAKFSEADEVNLQKNERAAKMQRLRFERWQGKYNVMAVSCSDLAWLADGILRVDHNTERRDRATLAKTASQTYQFCVQRDRRQRAQSAGPAGKKFAVPLIGSKNLDSMRPSAYQPFAKARSASVNAPRAAVTAGHAGASAYRGRTQPPPPRIDATLPPLTTGCKLRAKKRNSDSEDSSSSSGSASDSETRSASDKASGSESDSD